MIPERRHEVVQKRLGFLVALGAATLLPLFAGLAQRQFGFTLLGNLNASVAFLAGGFHVALTSFFYVDPALAPLRSQHHTRFYVIPLLLCVVGGATAFISRPNPNGLLFFFFAWQLYHYQRQNFGVLAFVSSSLQVARPSRFEQVTVELGGYAGVLGFLAGSEVTAHGFAGPWSGTMYLVARHVQTLAIAGSAVAVLIRLSREGWSWFVPWHLLCSSFFVVTFLTQDSTFAFVTYAYAHGLQYLVFMFVLSGARGQEQRRLGPVYLGGLGLIGSVALLVLENRGWLSFTSDAAFGVYLGLVMSHFVIDAIVWRLREPVQRDYARRAFSFVWAR